MLLAQGGGGENKEEKKKEEEKIRWRKIRRRYVKWCSEQVQAVIKWDDNEKRCKGKNPSWRRRRIPLG